METDFKILHFPQVGIVHQIIQNVIHNGGVSFNLVENKKHHFCFCENAVLTISDYNLMQTLISFEIGTVAPKKS